jgi:SAM-dependent methyltransferase
MLANYEEYANESLEKFAAREAAKRDLLVDAVKDLNPGAILDLGCGAGQELLPFLEKTGAICVGADSAAALGKMTSRTFGDERRAAFVRSEGENLPFADESFDVVLCRVALPYMNNKKAIAEIARVLKPNGVLLLKTHAPLYYFGLIGQRAKTLSARQIAYPLICLAASFWHQITGRQLAGGFWQGKEVFQTRAFLEREFEKNALQIDGVLPDDNRQTPSFYVVKMALLKVISAAQVVGEGAIVL